eukprot:365445-Chlamydomonas_euryale.AAC.23
MQHPTSTHAVHIARAPPVCRPRPPPSLASVAAHVVAVVDRAVAGRMISPLTDAAHVSMPPPAASYTPPPLHTQGLSPPSNSAVEPQHAGTLTSTVSVSYQMCLCNPAHPHTFHPSDTDARIPLLASTT